MNTSNRHIVLVFNPRSANFSRVAEEVIAILPENSAQYEVQPTDVDDNAAKLAKTLRDGDLVVSAGGDATATIAVNGCLLSGRDVVFAALPYGNFNDVARLLGHQTLKNILKGKTSELFPLDCQIDDRHFRYGLSYFTVGLLAAATKTYDVKAKRSRLRSGKTGSVRQLIDAMFWYKKNHKKTFLPAEYIYNGAPAQHATDFLAINGPRMARVMKSPNTLGDKQFFYAGIAKNRRWLSEIIFGLRSVLFRVPLKKTSRAILEFAKPHSVWLQGEGEYKQIAAKKIEIKKSAQFLKVIKL